MTERSPLFDKLSKLEQTMLSDGTFRADRQRDTGVSLEHPEARRIKGEIEAAIAKAVPEYEGLKRALRAVPRGDLALAPRRVSDTVVRDLPVQPDFNDSSNSSPAFYWLQTSVLPGDAHGITVESNGGSEVSVKGRAGFLGDERVVFRVGSESYFIGKTKNMITQFGYTAPQLWSAPVISVSGFVFGYTAYPFILSYGDKWAKCRLRYSHDVRQVGAAPGAPPVILTAAGETIGVIDEENNGKSMWRYLDMENYQCQAGHGFIPDAKLEHVFARVEIALEIELEGDAQISFVAPRTQQENQTPLRMTPELWAPHWLVASIQSIQIV